MGTDNTTPEHWDRVAAELKAYRDYQRQTWGDLDNEVIGRYLAGEAGPEEQDQVETALNDHPDLLMLTELVREVLVEPRPDAHPAPEPVVLSFSDAARSRRPHLSRSRRWFSVAAAACLFFLMGSLFSSPTLLQRGPTRGTPEGIAGLSASRGAPASFPAQPLDEPVKVVALNSKALVRSPAFHEAVPAPPLAVHDTAKRGGSVPPEAGPLGQAEEKLRRAYGLRKQTWGTDDPRTLEALADLASLYEDVLAVNAGDERGKNDKAVLAPVADRKPYETRKVVESQAFFARHGQVLPAAAVPVLLDGIEQDRNEELRKRCARTLAQMGPSAQEAARPLAERLARCECPVESEALAMVLAEIVGAEQLPSVVQTLERMEKAGPSDKQRQAASLALARMRKPSPTAGVRDMAGVYQPRTLALVNTQLKRMAERHRFVLVVETVPTLPPNRDTRADYIQAWCQDRAQRNAAPRAIYILLSQNPPAARLAVAHTDPKNSLCCSPEFAHTLGSRIQDRLKHKDPDQGLREAVDHLEKALEGKARPE